jgi:hypothetical protein
LQNPKVPSFRKRKIEKEMMLVQLGKRAILREGAEIASFKTLITSAVQNRLLRKTKEQRGTTFVKRAFPSVL